MFLLLVSDFMNATNMKAAQNEICKQKIAATKNTTDVEELKEKAAMIEGAVMATVVNIQASNIRGAITKVLYNERKKIEKREAEEAAAREAATALALANTPLHAKRTLDDTDVTEGDVAEDTESGEPASKLQRSESDF